MPKVQVYDQAQVRPNALPDSRIQANVSPTQFGSGVGQGLSELGRNAAKMQAEDDAIAATDIFNQASEEARKYLNEGPEAVFARQGKNAVGLHDTSKKFFEETQQRYSDNLTNENQRKAFKAMWLRRTETNLDNIARYEAAQRKEYFKSTHEASLQGAAAHAANNFNKPGEVQSALTEIDTIIRSNPAGESEEVVLNKQAVARSVVHKSVIDRMMIDDPDGARKYYADHKKEIEGQHHQQIESSLKGNKQRKQAQELADKINTADASDEEKRNMARNEKNPEVRALAEAIVNQDISQRKTDRIESERQMGESFWTGFIKNPDARNIPENLPSSVKLQAMKYAADPFRKTDLKAWNDLNQLAINSPEEFAKVNLYDHFTSLDEPDFQEFGKLQRSIKTGDKQTLTHVQSISSKATKALKAISVKVDSDKGQLFMRKFQDEVYNLEQNEKRKIRPEEVDKVIDRLLIQGEIDDGSLFGINLNDPDRRLFEVDETDKFFISDVPKSERQKIINAYKARGIDPTEDQIINLYTLKQTKR